MIKWEGEEENKTPGDLIFALMGLKEKSGNKLGGH